MNIDSLKKILPRARSGREQAFLNFHIGAQYTYDDVPDSAILYLSRTTQPAKIGGLDSLVMEAEYRLGVLYGNVPAINDAELHNGKAIAVARSGGYRHRLIIFLTNQSDILNMLGRYSESIRYCEEALTVALSLHDKRLEALVYNTIAVTYMGQDRPDLAMENANRSILIYDSLKKYDELVDGYLMMSQVLEFEHNYKEMLKYAVRADSLARVINYKEGMRIGADNIVGAYWGMKLYDTVIALCKKMLATSSSRYTQMYHHLSLGKAYSGKGQLKDGLEHLLIANKINDSGYNDLRAESALAMEIADVYLQLHKLDSALRYALRLKELIDKHDIRLDGYEHVRLLADVYYARGDMKNAALHYKDYAAKQDSAFAGRMEKNVAEQEVRFKLGDKNRALELLAKENELQKVRGQKQLIALIFSVVIVAIIIVVYRRAMQKNKLLAQQKQQIDEQYTQLEAASKMKAKFLANVSHELRTPSTLLTGMLQLLKDNTQHNEKIDIAYNNSKRLQAMIEELLDLSRVERNIDEVYLVSKEIGPVLKRIVFAFEALIQSKGLSLTTSIPANTVYVAIDEDKFEKVMNNLVYNAIKFNKPGGSVSIALSLTADGRHAEISVRDTGVGISRDDLPFVFERFYQGDTSRKAKSEGVGIGLSLVREFAEQMSGEITVDSVVDAGTTFTLRFPVAAAPATDVATDEEAPVIPQLLQADKNTVLVVEDNTEMRYYLREVLGGQLNVVEAGNGKEALASLAQHTPDIIVSDMMMPEMDGREFVSELKRSEAYSKIPVVSLTALADKENHLSMLRLGVDDYIVKPFNADELRIRIYNLLNNFAARRQFNQEPREADDVVVSSDAEATAFREKIKNYVLANMKKDVSVGDLAAELLLSERQLYRLSQSLTGCSPAVLIKEVRLQKAYELLLSGEIYKLDDVARRVGFETTTYFSRLFYERFGKRPVEFL